MAEPPSTPLKDNKLLKGAFAVGGIMSTLVIYGILQVRFSKSWSLLYVYVIKNKHDWHLPKLCMYFNLDDSIWLSTEFELFILTNVLLHLSIFTYFQFISDLQ